LLIRVRELFFWVKKQPKNKVDKVDNFNQLEITPLLIRVRELFFWVKKQPKNKVDIMIQL